MDSKKGGLPENKNEIHGKLISCGSKIKNFKLPSDESYTLVVYPFYIGITCMHRILNCENNSMFNSSISFPTSLHSLSSTMDFEGM